MTDKNRSARSNHKTQEIISEMARRIVDRFHPQKIILFGSHARGSAGGDSDVDLLVVMGGPGRRREKTVEIYRLLAGIGLPKDVIVATPEEIERYRETAGTVFKHALREGKVLYEKAS